MYLEGIRLSKIIDSQKDKYYITTHLYEICKITYRSRKQWWFHRMGVEKMGKSCLKGINSKRTKEIFENDGCIYYLGLVNT